MAPGSRGSNSRLQENLPHPNRRSREGKNQNTRLPPLPHHLQPRLVLCPADPVESRHQEGRQEFRLGLIGFVFTAAGKDVFIINLYPKGVYIHSAFSQIGFVSHD